MGWVVVRPGGEVHEGYVAMLGPDGRASGSSGRDGILFPNPRRSKDSAEPFDITVPWSEVIGWRIQCECGWRGTTWRRDEARNDDPDAEDMYPEHMLLPTGLTLEDVGEEEWKHHVLPLVTSDGVRAAVLAVGEAEAALDAAVMAARESYPPATWEQIGQAAGITRQSAHDRWAHKIEGQAAAVSTHRAYRRRRLDDLDLGESTNFGGTIGTRTG